MSKPAESGRSRRRFDGGDGIGIAGWTALAALAELVSLRILTRTLIHIPGLQQFELPIRVVSEIGRISYYLAVVLLFGLLVSVVRTQIRVGNLKSSVLLAGLGLWVLAAGAGLAGWPGPGPMGMLSLAAFLLVAGVVVVRGWQTLPIFLLTVATWAIGLATILQGRGGGLSGEAFGALMGAGDAFAIAALLSLPVLTGRPPTRRAWMVGLGVAALVTLLISVAGPTFTILVLWSFGLPASLPPVLYGLAAGSLGSALFSVWHDRRRDMAAALILLIAGGVGLVSSYQTGLVLAGLAVAAIVLNPDLRSGTNSAALAEEVASEGRPGDRFQTRLPVSRTAS
jgi:hypothetical protein